MSTSKRVRVHCDIPGCSESIDTSAFVTDTARKRARSWGWDGKGNRDRCPMCKSSGYELLEASP